jgi:hypothetical protein
MVIYIAVFSALLICLGCLIVKIVEWRNELLIDQIQSRAADQVKEPQTPPYHDRLCVRRAITPKPTRLPPK